MKNLIFILLLFLLNLFARSQNLVPNPSFEDSIGCPIALDELYLCDSWVSLLNSPDYFHACSFWVGVPYSSAGYQYANTGNAMAGAVMYEDTVTSSLPETRELFGTQLISPMVIGQKYYFSFFVNFSGFDQYQAIACNNIGIRFSVSSYSTIINNSCHFKYDTVIIDTLGWTRISGSLVADSVYQYIQVGNFYHDEQTDTIYLGSLPNPGLAYYFFDDFCVTTDSLYNENWVSVSKTESENEIIAFPNPFQDRMRITNNKYINDIAIFDLNGVKVFEKSKMYLKKYDIDLSKLNIGIYLLEINLQNEVLRMKIIKTK